MGRVAEPNYRAGTGVRKGETLGGRGSALDPDYLSAGRGLLALQAAEVESPAPNCATAPEPISRRGGTAVRFKFKGTRFGPLSSLPLTSRQQLDVVGQTIEAAVPALVVAIALLDGVEGGLVKIHLGLAAGQFVEGDGDQRFPCG